MQTQTEIRNNITNRVVESLKAGKIPWRKPWTGVEGPRLPTNLTTLKAYSGINIPILWMAGQERGFTLDYWASYKQWESVGAHVKKGEKATNIVFFKPIQKSLKDDDGIKRSKSFPFLRVFPLFNIYQVEGDIPEKFLNRPAKPIFEVAERSEFDRIVQATGANIRFGGDKARYFRPPADHIEIPHEGYFENFAAFAETLLHELSHFSEHRLGWEGSYALGELRAELAAVFMMAALNFQDSGDLTNHVAYLGHWLQALENDPRFLFKAAAAASRSADYILSFSRPNLIEAEAESAA